MKKLLYVFVSAVLLIAAGCSSGTPATTTTTAATSVPPAPTGLMVTPGAAQVTLSWTASLGATSYNVYYATMSGVTTSSTSKTTGLTTTTCIVSSLNSGIPYFFVVTAVNVAGESAVSSQVTATPVAPVPATPILTATAGNAQVALSWTASAGALTYNLYYSLTAGVTIANGTKISGLSTLTYTQTGLSNGSTYYYVVTAVNAAGESAASTQATAKPLAPLPSAPTALTATPGNSQVALSWTASTSATSYNLYYATSASVTPSTGTKVGAIAGTSYTVSGLTNGTLYYFIVTAVNGTGESVASAAVSSTPSNGVTVLLTPGTAVSGTLQATTATSLTYTFPATAVSANAVATINPITQASLPVPLAHAALEAMPQSLNPEAVQANDTFIASFSLSLNPASITSFNVPIGISGSVGSGVPVNTTLVLAKLQNGAWVDVSTFLIKASGAINQNLVSVALPGLLTPGTYLIYKPAAGNNTSVSNLGLVLFTDGSNNVQILHLYDSKGALLTTPLVSYLGYSGTNDLAGLAVTPDGSQGIVVSDLGKARLFSALQTGTPVASNTILDLTAYRVAGFVGQAVSILPSGDEAVLSSNSAQLVVASGILAGTPVAAMTIPVPNNRDGLLISNDGSVLLARGYSGLTVFSITPTAPKAGPIGGTVSHSYSQTMDFAALGTDGYITNDRCGMAFSPVDSSRAVVVRNDSAGGTVQVMTGLTTANPLAGTSVNLPTGIRPYAVSVSLDGKLAIIGTSNGLLLYKGVDTGTPTLVGTTTGIGYVPTLGITLDGKYVVAVATSKSLFVIPFTANGFGASAASIGLVTQPSDDQLIIH